MRKDDKFEIHIQFLEDFYENKVSLYESVHISDDLCGLYPYQ